MTTTTAKLLPVTDCAQCVWTEWGATDLDPDFAREYRHALDIAGRQAIQEPLIQAWRDRGFLVELRPHSEPVPAGEPAVPCRVYDAVRCEAVSHVSGEELLHRADLVAEYEEWVR